MDIDPIFHAIDAPDVSNVHNIEFEDDVDACGPEQFDAAQECDFMGLRCRRRLAARSKHQQTVPK